jgi:hypothetical protein
VPLWVCWGARGFVVSGLGVCVCAIDARESDGSLVGVSGRWLLVLRFVSWIMPLIPQ